MTRKISHALFIPAISLLPFTQSLAIPDHSHHPVETTASHIAQHATPESSTTTQAQTKKANLQAASVSGKMINSSTIQINTQNLEKLHQHHQTRIISLIDKDGVKQRYVLLSPNRSQLIAALIKFHGRLKEFDFYTVVDEKGDNTNLLASKRIVTAPANQLTAVFKTSEDAQAFLAKEQELLINEEIQSANTAQQEQSEEYNQQISSISNKEAQLHMNDSKKSKIVEPVHLFPLAAALKVKA